MIARLCWVTLLFLAAKATAEELSKTPHHLRQSKVRGGTTIGKSSNERDLFAFDHEELINSRSKRNLSTPKQKLSISHQSRNTDKDKDKDPAPMDNRTNAGGVPERVILYCDFIMDLDQCWHEINDLGEDVVLKHRLVQRHALAVEADASTIQDLQAVGFDFSMDTVRETLAIQESLQYHRSLENQQQIPYGLDQIRATDVWSEYNVRGEGVRVCVVDTGVATQHPDLDTSRINGWNSTEDFVTPYNEDLLGHGTHISGVIAASDNDRGFVGVAPNVEIYAIRVFTDEGKFYGSDVVAAAEACRDNGAHFISMSLGGLGFDQGEYEIFQDLYLQDGIISIASAGNTGGPEMLYPASYSNVISVSASDEQKRIPSFSTFNSFVDIAAPGANIPSTYVAPESDADANHEVYATLSGTSMAVPYITGTLALMKSFDSDATADELLYALTHSTQSLMTNIELGLVDAFAAIEILNSDKPIENPTQESSSDCVSLTLSIVTDRFGSETAYRLRRMSDNAVLWKGIGLDANRGYMEVSCLASNECYEFIIRDSHGDGILEPGSIELAYGDRTQMSDGDFGRGGKLLFGENC